MTTEVVELLKYLEMKWDVRWIWTLVVLGECFLNINMSTENFIRPLKAKQQEAEHL